MRLGDVLIDGMENGWLVRNMYMIPERILKSMDEKGRNTAERYNAMISTVLVCRNYRKKESYWKMVLEALEMWQELEHEFPELLPEDVIRILERNRLIVRYDRCVDVAFAASRFRRYFTFTEILREVRFSRSFSGVGDTSVNKILSRVLGYLESSGMLVKTWRDSKSRADVIYFRLFRMMEYESKNCRYCWIIRELRRILERAERINGDEP